MKEVMHEWMRTLVSTVAAWPGVSVHEHQFAAVEFRLGTREIGHVHDYGEADIPFTATVRDALIRSGLAGRHHWLPDSGWITVRVEDRGADNVLKLLRLSWFRIELKSSDAQVASRALRNLMESGTPKEVLDAIAGSVASAHD